MKDGAVNVYRGRVLLIGQDRAGKTSLKRSIIGLPFNRKEKSTDGIEVDPSKFHLDVDEVRNWQPINERKQGFLGCSKDVAKVVVERMYTNIPVSRAQVREKLRGEAILQSDDNKNTKQVVTAGEKEEVSLVNQVCWFWFFRTYYKLIIVRLLHKLGYSDFPAIWYSLRMENT